MKGSINTITTAFIFTLLLSFRVNADEGWWTNLRIAGGVCYSKVEHLNIALEKEVLIYNGYGKCEVYFLFSNTSQQSISVDVGFPIKIVIPLKEGRCIIDPSDEILKKFNINEGAIRTTVDWNTFGQFNSFWDRQIQLVKNFTISQDGKKVDIDSVLVESQITKGDTAVIQFHFLHKLDFQPNCYSNVVVNYSSYSVTMDTGAPETAQYIIWRYILGTGRTWKGPIKDIYILVPDHLKPKLPKPFNFVGDFKKNKIFMTTNYEPLDEDEVDIRYINYSHGDFFYIHSLKESKTPKQSFVILKEVSSCLSQRTWINSYLTDAFPRADPLWNTIFNSYYTPFYKPPESLMSFHIIENLPVTCKNIGFGPVSLFDGLPESAWCEGVKDDGINEWVQFELKEDVIGLSIYNGFKKSPESFLWHDDDIEKVMKVEATYSNNNRVKLLEFISEDSRIKHEIELKDTPNKQIFEDISLPKGSYKLYIRDIYKGEKWKDTCLGEIEFYSASAKHIIEKDEFLKNVLFDHYGSILFPESDSNIRSKPMKLSIADAESLVRSKGYYDSNRNPTAQGFMNQYQFLKGGNIIYDEETGLMWQQGGSRKEMTFEHAMQYIDELSNAKFWGFDDWRLPTFEEAMSLVEPKKNDAGLYIDSMFDSEQKWIWTSDLLLGESWRWVVGFYSGDCSEYGYEHDQYVRAVRSAQLYKTKKQRTRNLIPTAIIQLRSEPTDLIPQDVISMLKKHDFYDSSKNKSGHGFENDLKTQDIKGKKIVFDETTRLMWQTGGSDEAISFEGANIYIDELNRESYAGFDDWRLPTLEEAMSLMEANKNTEYLYVSSMFSEQQVCIWTSDFIKDKSQAWVVYFDFGSCNFSFFNITNYVRAVRSLLSSEK